MKKTSIYLLVFCAIMLLSFSSYAQEWYSENANWIFDKQELLSFPAHGYVKYSVTSDTIINDTTAKVITINTVKYNGENFTNNLVIVHESNSRVYYWNGSQFKLMYDFNLNTGDTLAVDININDCDSVSPIIVDNISNININGLDLKVQDISYTLYLEGDELGSTINQQIVERIGYENKFIFAPSCIINDEFAYSGLRCYEDDIISYKNEWWGNHFPDVSCDSLINDPSNIKKIEKDNFYIFPNPSNDFVKISSKNIFDNDFYIEIYDLSGKRLNEFLFRDTATIDLRGYQSGSYIIKIYQNSSNVYMYNIIKI